MDNKLNKGEIICPKCNGDSWIHELVKEKEIIFTRYCRHCNGKGKLDWIDNLTNKSKKYYYNDINGFIIKNVMSLKSVQLGANLKIKPNNYIYYSFNYTYYSSSRYYSPIRIFDLPDICKYIKERKLVIYENPCIIEESSVSKYGRMLQVITYGKVIIKL